METFCILIHDIGYCGMNHLTKKDHSGHEVLGATIAGRLFGKEAYTLCMEHRKFDCKLEIPDEYSHCLMPTFIVWVQWIIEGNKGLMKPKVWKRYNKDRRKKRLQGQIFGGQFKDAFKNL